jgi:hypothetical protein
LKGCQFYFTCSSEAFVGYGQCSIEDGGFYFNEHTGKCDFPQNVCAPCGIKTENWYDFFPFLFIPSSKFFFHVHGHIKVLEKCRI